MKHDDSAYVEWHDAAKLQFFHALGLKDGDTITAPGLAVSHNIPLRRARETLHHALGCKLLQRTGPDRFVRWSEPDEKWCNPEQKKAPAKIEYTRVCKACGKVFTSARNPGDQPRKTCSRVCNNGLLAKAMKVIRAKQRREGLDKKKGKWWEA